MSDVIKDFEKQFEKLKKEIGFKPTLKELDEVFYISDFISKEGYVSTSPFKQICRRIIDVYGVWLQYLHGLLMPNPGNIVNMAEAQSFNEEEKEKMNKLIERMMIISTNYNLVVLNMDTKQAKELIDEAYSFWKTELNSELTKFMEKTGGLWKERLNTKPAKKKKDSNAMFG
jgi:hypothetical protein